MLIKGKRIRIGQRKKANCNADPAMTMTNPRGSSRANDYLVLDGDDQVFNNLILISHWIWPILGSM